MTEDPLGGDSEVCTDLMIPLYDCSTERTWRGICYLVTDPISLSETPDELVQLIFEGNL